MKRYYFINDSWNDEYDGLHNICYNLDPFIHSGIIQNGSSHSVEDCYEQVLKGEDVLPKDWQPDDDMNWEEEGLYLQELMEKNGLQIVIEDNETGVQEIYP